MLRWMLVPPIARGVIQRRRRCATTEWSVITDINPDMSLDRLALGRDRHRGVVAVQALGGEHVPLDQRMKRLQDRRAGAALVGQRRDAKLDAFAPIAFALPVQGLVLAKLLE